MTEIDIADLNHRSGEETLKNLIILIIAGIMTGTETETETEIDFKIAETAMEMIMLLPMDPPKSL
jgi:hypothetical protein